MPSRRERLRGAEGDPEVFGLILDHYGVRWTPTWYGWQSVPCCFHDESVPSLRVNATVGGFDCMACGVRGGDGIDFIQAMEGIGYPDAKHRFEQITGTTHQSGSGPGPKNTAGRRAYKPKFKRLG